MPILNSFMLWFVQKRINQIKLFMQYPIEVQQELFFKLIEKAQNTEFGKKYDYKSILREGKIENFKNSVPLHDYNSLKPYIDRLRAGEQNILWHSPIHWFAKSSGTTDDKSKFIPVSKEALEDCHFKGGKDVIAIYASQSPNTKMLSGKSLSLGGSHQINKINNKSYFGDLSAVLIQNLPFWAQYIRTPNIKIALMDEWEAKLERMAEATIKENVISLAGVPSWMLVLAKRILEITGKNNLHEVWKNLEVFVHGGVSFVPYREQYKKIVDTSKMKFLETYNASEGFFGIQDDPNTDDMLLMLDYGIFYEFIPMECADQEQPKTLLLGEVELNKNYALVISTNGGLWRYIIGDTVKFTSLFPFKIKITGRIKHFINAFGEELIIDNAEKALKTACEQTGAEIREYTAAPIYMSETSKGGHQWLIEFSKKPTDLNLFAKILDDTLKTLNSDYEAKRYKNMTLNFPLVQVMKDGIFYYWLKTKGKLGGQHKVPRLANSRIYIDEIIELSVNYEGV